MEASFGYVIFKKNNAAETYLKINTMKICLLLFHFCWIKVRRTKSGTGGLSSIEGVQNAQTQSISAGLSTNQNQYIVTVWIL